VPNSERLGKGPMSQPRPLACTSLCPRAEQAVSQSEIVNILEGNTSTAVMGITKTDCFDYSEWVLVLLRKYPS